MKTVKLYDNDAELSGFQAEVLSCESAEGGYKIILDKTAFFPESGGQPGDIGFMEKARVLATFEAEGEIYHLTDAPFTAGQKVKCAIDFERRFGFMQNHSGEHIISGIVYKEYGFDNIGFHLNDRMITVDFGGTLGEEDILKIELLANKAVFENRNIRAFFPNDSEIKALDYRSKKEVDGPLRLVEIEGIDLCACCAPHVSKTGQIGLIKLLSHEHTGRGTRITAKCGFYALADYREKQENIFAISNLLSAKQEQCAEAVNNLHEKLSRQKQINTDLKRRMIEILIKSSPKEQSYFYEPDFDMRELQLLADGLHKTYGGIKAVFSGKENSFNFAICGEDEALQPFFAKFKENFAVKGGGRNGMVQGSVSADIEKIEEFFKG